MLSTWGEGRFEASSRIGTAARRKGAEKQLPIAKKKPGPCPQKKMVSPTTRGGDLLAYGTLSERGKSDGENKIPGQGKNSGVKGLPKPLSDVRQGRPYPLLQFTRRGDPCHQEKKKKVVSERACLVPESSLLCTLNLEARKELWRQKKRGGEPGTQMSLRAKISRS